MNFIRRLRNTHRLSVAVKEALDSLPSGVCYFTQDGTIKLCNTAMYDIYRAFTGSDLQSYSELTEALHACTQDTPVIRDGNIFLFPDGRAWKYSEREIHTEDGRHYTETVFDDVTELHRKRKGLEQQSGEMKAMYAELKALSGQLLEVTREQEILNMKTRLHDQMNMGITAIRQILMLDTVSAENVSAVDQFRRATRILQEENASPQDDLSEFIQDALVAGVHVNISGELPKEKENLRIAIAVMREACINAARHADASVLNIAADMTEDSAVLRITNDGRQPENEVMPRGGLLDLQKQISQAGGMLEIQSLPEFVLTVTLRRHDNRNEVWK